MPQAVIMAGGQGERFWPLTHKNFPKYRIRVDGRRSLLAQTFARLREVFKPSDIHVVTTLEHARMVRQELPGLRRSSVIVEPSRNNTASAITLSTALLQQKYGPDEIVSFFPADHLISNQAGFRATITRALALARNEDRLVTIGIQPTFAATSYGYIERGGPIRGTAQAYEVKRFVEKPALPTAERYIRKGAFLWNAGMFVWKTSVFSETVRRHCPTFARLDLRRLKSSYRRLPNVSIDVALLEKAQNIAVVRGAMDWCDVGNWDMLFEKTRGGANHNRILGACLDNGSESSLLHNLTGSPLVTVGLKNMIVVSTAQGTLVCPRGRAEEAALLLKKKGHR